MKLWGSKGDMKTYKSPKFHPNRVEPARENDGTKFVKTLNHHFHGLVWSFLDRSRINILVLMRSFDLDGSRDVVLSVWGVNGAPKSGQNPWGN